MTLRRIPLALSLGATVALAGPGALSNAAGTKTINVKDDVFSPKNVTIAKNTKVIWRFVGDHDHNVTSTGSKRFRSSVDKSSGTHKVTFKKAGVYRYVCTIHESQGMKGKITVK